MLKLKEFFRKIFETSIEDMLVCNWGGPLTEEEYKELQDKIDKMFEKAEK